MLSGILEEREECLNGNGTCIVNMKNKIIAIILFLLVFSIYLYHLCPSVSEGDSGEFITAAVNLSIPHAPSYPLYTAIGKIFENLIPWGNPGYRVNLASAVSAALAVVIIFLILSAFDVGIIGSLIGSLSLAWSSHFFENSIVAEVFGLHSLLVAAVLYSVCATVLKDFAVQRKGLYCAAFIAGLAVGNHQTIVLLGPGLLVWFFAVHADSIKQNRLVYVYADLLVCSIVFVLGLSMYLFLMVRSSKNPFLDWSNPETMHNLWRVFTRADYGSFRLTLGEQMPLTPANWFRQVIRYCSALIHEFTWAGVIAGITGFICWLLSKDKKMRYMGLAVAICFISSSIVFLTIANMPFTSEASGIMGRFYIMPAIIFILGAGYVFILIKNMKYSYLAIFGFLLPIILLLSNQKVYSRRDFFIAYDYSKNILSSLPRDSVLFIDGGDDTFYTLAYATEVLHFRKDVRIHDRGGLIFPNPYGSDFRRIGKNNKPQRRWEVESAVLGSPRPLFYSTMNLNVLEGAELYYRGLVMRAEKKGFNDKPHNLWQMYRLRGLYPCRWTPHIYRVRALVPFFDYLRGMHEYDMDNINKGMQYFKRAFQTGYDIEWFLKNVTFECLTKGYEFFNQGDYKEAEKMYRFILELRPEEHMAYINLGVLAEKKGDLEESEDYYMRALEIKPDYVDAHYNLSVIYWQMNDWDKVIEKLRTVLHYKPDHQQARRYLNQALLRKDKGKNNDK